MPHPPLILRCTLTSPFARKVRIAMAVAGLAERVTVQLADHGDPEDSLRSQNPLGKVPTLLTSDGEALFDSRVILEYFHDLAPEAGLIPQGHAKFCALRQQALADGICDAGSLQVYEARFRAPELHVKSWLDYQQGKVERALSYAEVRYTATLVRTPHVGEIALACALGFLDLRFGSSWRAKYPQLYEWLVTFEAQVPAFSHTEAPAPDQPKSNLR